MVKFFTLIFFIATSLTVSAQAAEDTTAPARMTPAQLKLYRQFIWDSVPTAVGWVNDYGLLFETAQEDTLEKKIAEFEKETSVEIMVVTTDSFMVDKQQFNEFAYRLLRIWGIGKIARSNGMVICICKDSRKIYICTDFGIDRLLTKRDKHRIIKKVFIPWFIKDDYYTGTYEGLMAIQGKIYKNWKKYNPRK